MLAFSRGVACETHPERLCRRVWAHLMCVLTGADDAGLCKYCNIHPLSWYYAYIPTTICAAFTTVITLLHCVRNPLVLILLVCWHCVIEGKKQYATYNVVCVRCCPLLGNRSVSVNSLQESVKWSSSTDSRYGFVFPRELDRVK